MAMPEFVAYLSVQKSMFDALPVPVGFVMDKRHRDVLLFKHIGFPLSVSC